MAHEPTPDQLERLPSRVAVVPEFCTPDGKVFTLLLQRPNTGNFSDLWEFPGGKPEGGLMYTPEFEQETGINFRHLSTLVKYVIDENQSQPHQLETGLRARAFMCRATFPSLPPIQLSPEHQNSAYIEVTQLYNAQGYRDFFRETSRQLKTGQILNGQDTFHLTPHSALVFRHYLDQSLNWPKPGDKTQY